MISSVYVCLGQVIKSCHSLIIKVFGQRCLLQQEKSTEIKWNYIITGAVLTSIYIPSLGSPNSVEARNWGRLSVLHPAVHPKENVSSCRGEVQMYTVPSLLSFFSDRKMLRAGLSDTGTATISGHAACSDPEKNNTWQHSLRCCSDTHE